jgi:MATE family multidrug resistance protein
VDYALVLGRFGMPSLGATGAAVATCCCQVFQCVVAAWLAREPLGAAWAASVGTFDWERLRSLLRMGAPLGIQVGTEVWAFNAAAFMAGWLGAVDLAAHGVVINLASLTFMLPLGVSTAAASRVGNLLGSGQPWGRTVVAAYVLGLGSMLLGTVGFALIPEWIAGVYTVDPVVLAAAASILPIAAAFQLFDGTQVVSFGVLRGAGDTRLPAVANVLGYYALGLPVGAWLAFREGMGLAGLWIGLATGLATVAVLLVFRVRWTFARGGFRVGLAASEAA